MEDKNTSNMTAVTDYIIKNTGVTSMSGESTSSDTKTLTYDTTRLTNRDIVNTKVVATKWVLSNKDILDEMITKYNEQKEIEERQHPTNSLFYLESDYGKVAVIGSDDYVEIISMFYNNLHDLLTSRGNKIIMDKVKRLYPKRSKQPFCDFKSCTLYDAKFVTEPSDVPTVYTTSCFNVIVELSKEIEWINKTIESMTLFEALTHRKEVGLMLSIKALFYDFFAGDLVDK